MGSILDKLKSLAPALASTETLEKRLGICDTCEHYIKKTTTCKKCGCFMSIKAKIVHLNCPIGKW
jgi:hypothetical protein